MKKTEQNITLLIRNYFLLIFLLLPFSMLAQVNNLSITENAGQTSFSLFTTSLASSFYYDIKDATVVEIAAKAFQQDIKAISGKEMPGKELNSYKQLEKILLLLYWMYWTIASAHKSNLKLAAILKHNRKV